MHLHLSKKKIYIKKITTNYVFVWLIGTFAQPMQMILQPDHSLTLVRQHKSHHD